MLFLLVFIQEYKVIFVISLDQIQDVSEFIQSPDPRQMPGVLVNMRFLFESCFLSFVSGSLENDISGQLSLIICEMLSQ